MDYDKLLASKINILIIGIIALILSLAINIIVYRMGWIVSWLIVLPIIVIGLSLFILIPSLAPKESNKLTDKIHLGIFYLIIIVVAIIAVIYWEDLLFYLNNLLPF